MTTSRSAQAAHREATRQKMLTQMQQTLVRAGFVLTWNNYVDRIVCLATLGDLVARGSGETRFEAIREIYENIEDLERLSLRGPKATRATGTSQRHV